MNLKTVSEIYDTGMTMDDIKKVQQMNLVNEYLNVKYKNFKTKQKDVCRDIGITPYRLNKNLRELDSRPLHKPNSKPTGKRDLVYNPETGKMRDRNSKSYKKEMKMNLHSENNSNTTENSTEKPISKIPRKSKGWNTNVTGGTTEEPTGGTNLENTSDSDLVTVNFNPAVQLEDRKVRDDSKSLRKEAINKILENT